MTIIDSTPEKIVYTQKELIETPLVLAIYYKQRGKQGVFFSSKCQRDTSPFFEIYRPGESEITGVLANENCRDEMTPIGMIAGVGNQSELESMVNKYRQLLFGEINSIGMYKNISREVRLAFAGVLNREFRNRDSDVPCRVEMLLVTRFFEDLEIFRIKGDGDFHPLPRFGVVGGHRKIRGKKITLRAMALKLLKTFYEENNRPPNLKEADEIANLALNEDKRDMPHSFVTTFSF
jgi:hypothetical protein